MSEERPLLVSEFLHDVARDDGGNESFCYEVERQDAVAVKEYILKLEADLAAAEERAYKAGWFECASSIPADFKVSREKEEAACNKDFDHYKNRRTV